MSYLDSSDDDVDRRIQAELGAILGAPRKRTRRTTPPHLRAQQGRLALQLWREYARYSRAKDRYEKWWFSLDNATRGRINNAIVQFESCGELMAAWRSHARPNAVQFDIDPAGWRFDELRERLPRVTFEEFADLRAKPEAERKRWAEKFGKDVTKLLKESLEMPNHRPKVKLSKADREDDKWLRRLAAYILNFPDRFS